MLLSQLFQGHTILGDDADQSEVLLLQFLEFVVKVFGVLESDLFFVELLGVVNIDEVIVEHGLEHVFPVFLVHLLSRLFAFFLGLETFEDLSGFVEREHDLVIFIVIVELVLSEKLLLLFLSHLILSHFNFLILVLQLGDEVLILLHLFERIFRLDILGSQVGDRVCDVFQLFFESFSLCLSLCCLFKTVLQLDVHVILEFLHQFIVPLESVITFFNRNFLLLHIFIQLLDSVLDGFVGKLNEEHLLFLFDEIVVGLGFTLLGNSKSRADDFLGLLDEQGLFLSIFHDLGFTLRSRWNVSVPESLQRFTI